MLWLPGIRPGPHWASLQRTPRSPCCNKQYFIQNNYRNAQEKAILNFVTPINITSDWIKELFMLVIALCTTCFSRAEINKKNFGPRTLRFGPSASNALASALAQSLQFIVHCVIL